MNNVFGKRLRKLRRDKDITMDDMAKDLSTTQATLSRYENGKRKPDVDFLEMLSDYFDVTTDYLLGKSDTKKQVVYQLTDNYISEVRELVKEYGYDINNKSKEDIALMLVKSMKLDEINKL